MKKLLALMTVSTLALTFAAGFGCSKADNGQRTDASTTRNTTLDGSPPRTEARSDESRPEYGNEYAANNANATANSNASDRKADAASTHNDLQITRDVKKSLNREAEDLNNALHRVKVNTKDGKVTLTGTVKTDQEKSLIEDIVKKSQGVDSVDNQLQVQPQDQNANNKKNRS